MLEAAAEATRWEHGCQLDDVRNHFIAPHVTRLIEQYRPASILDVGTGTAYLPRVIDQSLSYRPHWTLIDLNSSRLALAEQLVGPAMQAVTVVADILSYQCAARFDAVLTTFTMLEIADADRFVQALPALLNEDGLFIVSLPDAWPDVLAHGASDANVVQAFLSGSVALPKVDKFTGDSYPFQATRTETLISRVLAEGFSLFELIESQRDRGTYLLAFHRRRDVR
jgi:SAM-dependent methyltransferase